MKLSQSFVKSQKNIAKQIQAKNAIVLAKAGFINQELSGVYSYLPLGLVVLNKIENIVRKEMNKISVEVLMPTLSNISNWQTTKRVETVDVLFKAVGANEASIIKNSSEYIINSTHEEIITPLVQHFAKSYKDFPISVYQIQSKFRNEARAKSGLLRGREFRMKDLYSFHTSKKDLNSFYEKMKIHYMNIFNELGIGEDTFITYASGGDFTSEYSHEFQTILDAGEDIIYLDRENNVAYNKEIVTPKDAKKLNVDFDSLEQVSASEVGNIFPLYDKFSQAFDYHFTDENNVKKIVYMGCYGIGTSRLMGLIAEKFSDEKGLVWPEKIAPFRYHLISIPGKNVNKNAEKIYNALGDENCLFDDRNQTKISEKFNDFNLIGCPIQIVISEKTLENNAVEVSCRMNNFDKFYLDIANLDTLKNL